MSDICIRLQAGNKKYMTTVDKGILFDTAENGQHPIPLFPSS